MTRGILSATGFTSIQTYSMAIANSTGNVAVQASNGGILVAQGNGTVRSFEPNGALVNTSAVYPGYDGGLQGSLTMVGNDVFHFVTVGGIVHLARGTWNGTKVNWSTTTNLNLSAANAHCFDSAYGHSTRLYFSAGDSNLFGAQIVRYDSVFGGKSIAPNGAKV